MPVELFVGRAEKDDEDVEDFSAVVDLEMPELADACTDGDEFCVASDDADVIAVSVLETDEDPIKVAFGDGELEVELLAVLVNKEEPEILALVDAAAENDGGNVASDVFEAKSVERAEAVATTDAVAGWLGASLGDKDADAEATAVDAGD